MENGRTRTPVGVRLDRIRPADAERELFFHDVLNRAPFGVVVASMAVDGGISFVNEEFTAITGYTRDDIPTVEQWLLRAYPDEAYRSQILANWPTDVALDNRGRDVVYRVTCRDGTRKELQLRASHLEPGRMIVMALDLSRQRRAEARLSSIIQAAPIGLGLVARTPSRTLTWVNDVVCTMLGYAAEELVGQSARMLYAAEEEFNRVGQEKYHEIARGRVGTVETRWRRKDGELVDVLLSSTPLDQDDPTSEVTFTALDISARARAERDREELQARMVQTQKLESLGILSGGIAHEFNNLLLGIMGNADMALLDLPDDSPVRTAVVEVETAARRASELTRQLLAYSGKSRFVVQPVDPSELVAGMRQLLEVAVSKKASLRFELASGLPRVEADRAQLRQVMVNLVTNASEALGGGEGQITVTTRLQRCDAELLRGTFVDDGLPPGDYVAIQVRDTGEGMDEETRMRICDPFFSTKFTGRGLGLAAVLGIARGHRGALYVDSAPGRGTTLAVLLPTMAPVEATEQPVPAAAPAAGQATVLLVDDDLTVRRVGQRMVARMGYEVEVARDGAEAVVLFEKHAACICCVLLDLTMPGMDGIETMAALQRVRSDVCVILSSGYSEAEVKERYDAESFAGFIQKPYRFAQLEQVLSRLARPARPRGQG